LDINPFVLIGGLDKFIDNRVDISWNPLDLFFIKKFMFRDKGFKIGDTFLQFGDDKFGLVEVKELLDFKNVVGMVWDMERLFLFTVFANFAILFTVLNRAYEHDVRILVFVAKKLWVMGHFRLRVWRVHEVSTLWNYLW